MSFYKFFFAKDAAYRLRRLGALREPVLRPLCVDLHLNGIGNGVVLPDHFQKPAVLRTAFVDHHNPVMRAFFRPDP